jgi:thiol-disulfide isomerase/thioredoxin
MAMAARIAKSVLGWLPVIAVVLAIQLVANRGVIDAGRAPDLRGQIVGGESFAGLESMPKPAIVYFWASWCGVCQTMQSTIMAVASDTPIITIAMQSGDPATVSEYMIRKQFHVPTLVDEDGTVAGAYRLRGVPAAFMVGRDGNIRSATTGYTSEWGLRLRLWWANR